MLLEATGPGADAFFRDEPGGHRWQRVPPTEKRGRVHTSTVTVAVLDGRQQSEVEIRHADLRWDFFASGGPGGANQNAVNTGARVTHGPTGMVAESREHRTQGGNRKAALARLTSALRDRESAAQAATENAGRRAQVGSGQRGDKVRTYRVKDDVVTDHRSGAKARLSRVLRGDWEGLK